MFPRCPVRGCPVRFRGGPDRLCPAHQYEADANQPLPVAEVMGGPVDVSRARNMLAEDEDGAA